MVLRGVLEVVGVVLASYNLVDNQYQQNFDLLYTFTPNKTYTHQLNIEPDNLLFLKTYNIEFEDTIIIFTDQNGRLLEIDSKVRLTLLIS